MADEQHLMGCLPSEPRDVARAAWLPQYMSDVPSGPPVCQRTVGYQQWGMKGNNRYGCCVVSAAVHGKQAVSFVDGEGPVLDIPDNELIRVYLSLSPGDNGLNIARWLKYSNQQQDKWRIDAYGATDPRDPEAIKKCCWWFGNIMLGIGVPRGWSGSPGFVWDRVGSTARLAHAVEVIDYTERGVEIITWGYRGTITWAGLAEQCHEAWVTLPPEWYGGDQKAAPGLDVRGLQSYLAFITGQPDPYPEPPAPPTPVPPVPPIPPEPPAPPAPDNSLAMRYINTFARGIALLKAGHDELVVGGLDDLDKRWGK